MKAIAMILSAFENRLESHTTQTNPAVEQNKNVKWAESPLNQSGIGEERSVVESICQRAKS